MNCLVLGAENKNAFILQRLQDFERVTVIDPHGDLAEAAGNLVAHDDALYFDPSDTNFPVGLNLLDYSPEEICQLFEMLWPNGWGAQSDWLLANFVSVIPKKDTLMGVLKILSDMSYREACYSNCKDPVVQRSWDIIGGWDERQFNAATAPVLNKVGRLLMNPLRRNILCQEYSTISDQRIVIANLSGLDRLSARLFGYLLMKRPGEIVINDLGFFSTKKDETDDYLAALFAKDRFTVTLQFLRQVTKTLEDAVLSIPEKVVFRTNRHDAEALTFHFGLGNASVLTDLDPQEAQTADGKINPKAPQSLRRLKALKKLTRSQHARPKAQVEALHRSPSPR